MNLRLLKISAFALASVLSWCAISAGPAAAGPTVVFKFDNMGAGNSTSQGVGSSTISTYMTSVLQHYYAGATVSVSGAVGQEGTSSYAGDGHVVGPALGSPLTLANTNGSPSPNAYNSSQWDGFNNTTNLPTLNTTDGYIKNCTSLDSCSAGSSADIFINFNGHSISSFSFDFEIFPDGTCTANTYSGCGGSADANGHRPNLPDLEIWSGDNGTGTHFGTLWGESPGTGGTWTISSAMSGGETAPQLLGVATYTVAAGANLTTLDFMDWPETIGIDNLKVAFIPEPPTLAFLAFGFIGLAWIARRKRVDRV